MQLNSRQTIYFFSLSALIVIASLLLFNPSSYYFLNDDLIHIPLSKKGILFQRQSFRPIGDLSVQFDFLIWGKQAAGYHFTNLVLHISNTILVFLLSRDLFKRYLPSSGMFIESIMVSILFFVYAFHSETIFWILGRSASLGTLFFVPATMFYLRRHDDKMMVILCLVFFLFGLWSYESAWLFPTVALILSLTDPEKRTSLRKEMMFVALVWIVFLIHLFIRYQVINQFAGSYEAGAFLNFDVKELVQNFMKLVGRCFIPPTENAEKFVVGIIIFACITGVLLVSGRKRWINFQANKSLLILLTLLFVFSLFPYLSLGIDTHGVEGERFLYMPSIFVCLLSVTIINSFKGGNNLKLLLFTCISFFHLFFLMQSSSYYKTASAISKLTFNQINLLQGKQRIFIDSLPLSYKGALIFRSGFKEGEEWLKEVGSVRDVIVLSFKKDNSNWATPYQFQAVQAQTSRILSELDSAFKMHNSSPHLPVDFDKETDAWFIFENEGLKIVR